MKYNWQGWIIDESLKNPAILESFKITKKQTEENSEGSEKRIWGLYTVEVENGEIEKVVEQLSQEIKPEYYIHLTNRRELILVVTGKYFRLKVQSCEQKNEFGIGNFVTDETGKKIWQQAVDYVVNQVGLDQRYLIKVE